MLRGFARIGMWLIRAISFCVDPELGAVKARLPRFAFPPGFNLIDAFTRVARAVRLCVVLEMKIEQDLADLRAGRFVAPAAPEPKKLGKNDLQSLDENPEKFESFDECERGESLFAEGPVRFQPGDNFGKYLKGPLKDAVAKICADLGLTPDWSQWAEDEGFPPPPGGDIGEWRIFVAPETDMAPEPGPEGRKPWAPRPRDRQKRPWRQSWPPPGGVGPPQNYRATSPPRAVATSDATQLFRHLPFEGARAYPTHAPAAP